MIPANLNSLLDAAGWKRLGDSVSRPRSNRAPRSARPQAHRHFVTVTPDSFLDSLHCSECSTPLQSDNFNGLCGGCNNERSI